MPIITKRRVRCAAQVNAPFITTPLTDFYHRQNIETVQGNSTRFEFGFLTQEGEIYDMSNVESLNLKLLPSQTEAGALADQTLAAADLDLTVNAETWADGSKQHAVFAFTNGEMNLPTGTTARKVLWLVVTAILTDGSENTLAAGNLVLHEDNNATSDPPPENPGTAITLEQADARYAALADGRLPVLELDGRWTGKRASGPLRALPMPEWATSSPETPSKSEA